MKGVVIYLIYVNTVVGQISSFIPAERVVDWTNAGLIEPVPPIENVINIGPNDSLGLIHAIDNLDGTEMTLIQLSSGTYTLSQSITLKSNTILKGSNTGTTTELQFNNNDTSAIYIRPENLGSIIEFKIIQNITDLTKGSVFVEVADTESLSVGDYIHLIFNSDNHHFHSTSAGSISTYDPDLEFIGQMNQIKDINVNFIELEDELRFDYSGLDSGRVRFIGSETVKNVGIEDLKITGNDCSWLFWFDWATNCWVRGVESLFSQLSHIRCGHSSNMEITGNYIHHAESYGGSGAAYGVQLFNQTTNVLVENNIFKYLRHAMIVSHGANGNVFGYNYSFIQYSVDDNDIENFQGDISLHGHFPFANLFEGNLFEYARIDVWWGYAGPDNTFFRNRSKTRINNDSTTNEGFQIQWLNILRDVNDVEVSMGYEFSQNIAGGRCDYVVDVNNESASAFSIIHNTGLDFIHNNNDCNGSGGTCSDYENVLPDLLGDSYYHESQPTFLTIWPFDPNNYQSLPAYARYQSGNLTYNRNRYIDLINKSLDNDENLGGLLSLSVDNSIIEYNQILSGNKVQIPNRDITVNVQTHNDTLQGQKHLKWGNNSEYFKLEENNLFIESDAPSLAAKFDNQSSVTITSNIPNNTQLQIHDPWYYDVNTQTQPDNFQPLTSGQYQVFLEQNESFDPDLPIYRLKAPNIYATEGGIYEFDSWHGSGITFNASGDTATNSREANIVFMNANARVTAEYTQVNQLQNYTLTVPEEESLIIPPNALIDFASGFTIDLFGELVVDGNPDQPITLFCSDGGQWGGIRIRGFSSISIENVHINNASTAVNVEDLSSSLQIIESTFSNVGTGIKLDGIDTGGDAEFNSLEINADYAGIHLSGEIEEVNHIVRIKNSVIAGTGGNGYGVLYDNIDFWNNLTSNRIQLQNVTITANNQGMELIYTDGNPSQQFKEVQVKNCIIWGNSVNITNADIANSSISYSDVPESNSAYGNINENPQFVSPETGDYHLQYSSPCIDAGDPNSPNDPDGTIADIGAFYYQMPSAQIFFDPNMEVDQPPVFQWLSVDIDGAEIYYDIYYHYGNESYITFLATTQNTSYADLRYIVVEIEESVNDEDMSARRIKVIPQPIDQYGRTFVYYIVRIRDGSGHQSPFSNTIRAHVKRSSSRKEMVENSIPEEYGLSQGYPNPFNPAITLPYALPELSTVTIMVYDITGRRVTTLKNQMEEAGYYRIRWNGKNMSNIPLPSGMYIIQMTAKSMENGELFTKAQKVVLLK